MEAFQIFPPVAKLSGLIEVGVVRVAFVGETGLGRLLFDELFSTNFFLRSGKLTKKNWLEQKISIDISQMTKIIFFKFPTRCTKLPAICRKKTN